MESLKGSDYYRSIRTPFTNNFTEQPAGGVKIPGTDSDR